VARLLIKNGASVSAIDKYEWTPLHVVAKHGYEPVARLLIEKGANVSATTTDCNKWTPLHMATRYGQEAVALLLIQKGTDVSAIPPTATSGHHCTWPRSMGK
jgi:ankyrin repeat protein